MKSVVHEFIVKFIDYFEDDKGCYTVMELAQEDLNQVIKRRSVLKRPFSEHTVLNYTYMIIQALKYLHSKDIIHRDVKPLNVLVTGYDCKLADFGGVR